jgi:hypothetical protein
MKNISSAHYNKKYHPCQAESGPVVAWRVALLNCRVLKFVENSGEKHV